MIVKMDSIDFTPFLREFASDVVVLTQILIIEVQLCLRKLLLFPNVDEH